MLLALVVLASSGQFKWLHDHVGVLLLNFEGGNKKLVSYKPGGDAGIHGRWPPRLRAHLQPPATKRLTRENGPVFTIEKKVSDVGLQWNPTPTLQVQPTSAREPYPQERSRTQPRIPAVAESRCVGSMQ